MKSTETGSLKHGLFRGRMGSRFAADSGEEKTEDETFGKMGAFGTKEGRVVCCVKREKGDCVCCCVCVCC